MEATVQEMNTKTDNNDEKAPNNGVDQALMDRAYAVFSLVQEHQELGTVKPNEHVYTTFIRVLTKARVPNLAEKARLLLQRMRMLSSVEGHHALSLRPTKFTYNAVLLAATTDHDASSALGIALQTFNEMRKDTTVELDHVSIGNMLRCATMLEDPTKRMAFVQSTFRLGCQHGLVNTFLLRDLRLVTTTEQRQQLLGIDDYSEADDDDSTDLENMLQTLPREWTYPSTERA